MNSFFRKWGVWVAIGFDALLIMQLWVVHHMLSESTYNILLAHHSIAIPASIILAVIYIYLIPVVRNKQFTRLLCEWGVITFVLGVTICDATIFFIFVKTGLCRSLEVVHILWLFIILSGSIIICVFKNYLAIQFTVHIITLISVVVSIMFSSPSFVLAWLFAHVVIGRAGNVRMVMGFVPHRRRW